jgi:peroxiredoxin
MSRSARFGIVSFMNGGTTLRTNTDFIRIGFSAGAIVFAMNGIGCASTPPATAKTETTSASTKDEGSAGVLVTPEMGSPNVGEAAPDFNLVDQHGEHVKLSSLRGQTVVLAFVASYCPFSEAAQPHLTEIADSYAGKNVRVVAVDVREDDAAYAKYVSRGRIPFSVLHDPDGAVSSSFAPNRAMPGLRDRTKVVVTSNMIVDKEGKIRYFTLLDTLHFDAKLVHLRGALDRVLGS